MKRRTIDMNKLKQIAFILVLALSLTTFAACGKNNKDMNNGTNNHSVTENAPIKTEPTAITSWMIMPQQIVTEP